MKVLLNQAARCIYCQSLGSIKNGGIFILGKFICSKCEQKIVQLSCDAQDYTYYVNGLKKIWCCLGD
uniref:sigma factor G inhibitor Gin n=1 Tax=Desulforadius tongensis TaxID=1216062 RepID=UPI001957F500